MNFKLRFCLCFLFFCQIFFTTSVKSQTIAPRDVLISEVMANPYPSNGLAPVEYIELYNRSGKLLNLNGSVLFNGATTTTLPKFLLKPGGYVVIFSPISGLDFKSFGADTLRLPKLISLNNIADTITLVNSEGKIIDAMAYNKDSYGDATKAQGGFSLERSNFSDPCNYNSFIVSNNSLGGTPGKANSVTDTVKIYFGAVSATLLNDKTIQITFSEAIDAISSLEKERYTISPKRSIKNILVSLPLYNGVWLELDSAIDKSQVYQCLIKSEFRDCAGRLSKQSDTINVAFGKQADVGDLILNEIMFEPESNGARYLELYNKSAFPISLKDLKIADLSTYNNQSISSDVVIFPRDYVTLTPKPDYIIQRYQVAPSNQKKIFRNALPTWYYKYGNAALIKMDGNKPLILDSFNYYTSQHNPFLAAVEGVALERIQLNSPATNTNNWISAAAPLYGTPGKINSQFRERIAGSETETPFYLEKDIFSPDGDGVDDYLNIQYQNIEIGDEVTLKIYDISGNLVKTLAENFSSGEHGFFKWDGDTNNGARATSGFYWVLIELLSTKGTSQRMKKICTLYLK